MWELFCRHALNLNTQKIRKCMVSLGRNIFHVSGLRNIRVALALNKNRLEEHGEYQEGHKCLWFQSCNNGDKAKGLLGHSISMGCLESTIPHSPGSLDRCLLLLRVFFGSRRKSNDRGFVEVVETRVQRLSHRCNVWQCMVRIYMNLSYQIFGFLILHVSHHDSNMNMLNVSIVDTSDVQPIHFGNFFPPSIYGIYGPSRETMPSMAPVISSSSIFFNPRMGFFGRVYGHDSIARGLQRCSCWSMHVHLKSFFSKPMPRCIGRR